jgi:Ala-tRNA(Pro) deacylase
MSRSDQWRAPDIPRATTTLRVDAITYFLDRARIRYELLQHEQVMSAATEAVVTQLPPDHVAKTIVLHDGNAPVIAVVPASRRLDLHKVHQLFGAAHRLELAAEDQIARDFPLFDVGAIPPVGLGVPIGEVVDRRLLEVERILCPVGDRRHSVLVDPHDVARIANAQVEDICQD